MVLEEVRKIFLTSAVVAGKNWKRFGGGIGQEQWGEIKGTEGKEAESLVILSVKKFRKDVLRFDAKEKVGRLWGKVRDKSEFIIGQSFLGLFECWLICDL